MVTFSCNYYRLNEADYEYHIDDQAGKFQDE